jgi:hypothetical protein
MAHSHTDPETSTWVWTTTQFSSSADVNLNRLELCGLKAPAFEALTGALMLQTTDHGWDTADASATWVDAYDEAGTAISVIVGTTARRVHFSVDYAGLRAGRCRWKATQADKSTAVNQSGQSLSPILKYV